MDTDLVAAAEANGAILQSVIVDVSENGVFRARLWLVKDENSFDIARLAPETLAIDYRRKVSILVDETTSRQAGITLSG